MLLLLPALFIIFGHLLLEVFFQQQFKTQLMDMNPDPSAIWRAGFAVIFIFILTLYAPGQLFVPTLFIIVRRLRDAGYHWAFLFLYVGPYYYHLFQVLNIIGGIVSLPCSISWLFPSLSRIPKPEMAGNSYGRKQNFTKDNSLDNSHTIKVWTMKTTTTRRFQGSTVWPTATARWFPRTTVWSTTTTICSKPTIWSTATARWSFQGQQFGQQPQQPVQNQPFGQQPQQGGFQGQQFSRSQQPSKTNYLANSRNKVASKNNSLVSSHNNLFLRQSQAVEQTEPVQNPFTAETPEQSTPQDFETQAPVQDNPFVFHQFKRSKLLHQLKTV